MTGRKNITWPENKQKLPAEVETEAQYQIFLQYIFYTQWMKVKKAANDAGFVTVHTPLSREVFWHEYAKIPRHTSQNSIAAGNLE